MMADVELLKAKRHALFVAKNTNRYGDYDRLCAMIADLDQAIRQAEERGRTGVSDKVPGRKY